MDLQKPVFLVIQRTSPPSAPAPRHPLQPPRYAIDLLRRALLNELPSADPQTDPVRVRAFREHGAVSAILALAGQFGVERLRFHRPCPERSRALALVVCRLLRPGSKLPVERELGPSGQTTLAALPDLHDTPVDDLYDAFDWLADRQPSIERKLAKCHLQEDSLALYDISSSYLEGSRCPLAQRGYSRDHRADRPQIVYGLLCNPEGCPVECFAGNTADPDTLASQVARLRDRFGLQRVALVGDRGMIAQTRIKADLEPVGFDWITALRNKAIRKLAHANVIQPGLFDSYGFASVTAPDFPGERLLVCYNPLVAAERRRKREALLEATETSATAVSAGCGGARWASISAGPSTRRRRRAARSARRSRSRRKRGWTGRT